MKRAARLALVLIALTAALPPGWCCAAARMLTPVAEVMAPACCSCCPEPASDAESPAPRQAWCCERDPVAPAKAVPPVDAAEAVAWVDDVPSVRVDVEALEAPASRIATPPPRVLHCLWTC